jgi:hypothetical protein
MAYSDYGGYAYRNGARVEDRSDCTITPEGDTFGTPGCYPGFAMAAAGVSHDEVSKRVEWPCGHAVLGDGPIYVVLYKQGASAFRGPERIDANLNWDWNDDEAEEQRRTLEVDGYSLEVALTQEDNYYVYAKLTQPNGTVWHGFSGYGVGAGLEDAGYSHSTQDRIEALESLFDVTLEG